MARERVGGRDVRSSAARAPLHHGGSLGPAQSEEKALSAAVDGGALAAEVNGGAGLVRWPGGGNLSPKGCS
jgi:hypothetical protein